LFNRFHIENQFESAYRREVTLPSGGEIVIDHTEALISIDINSARATKGSDIEETATNTNLEAADEIARQLRLRDLGGLVVIDFIDMMNNRNQRAVENRLNNAVQVDRARVQIGRISRFGLMEMSRQRLKPSLGESTQIVCPRCTGQGTIRTVESLSLSLVRILEEEALKAGTARVDIQVPVDVATYLLNEKREAIFEAEKQTGVHVLIVANPTLETPQYKVERVRKSDYDENDETASYQRAEKDDQYSVELTQEKAIQPEKAAVSSISPGRRPEVKAPVVEEKVSSPGLFGKLVSIFTGEKEEKEEEKTPAKARRSNRGGNQRGRNQGEQNRNSRNRNSRNRNRKPANKQGGDRDNKRDSAQKGSAAGSAAGSANQADKKAADSRAANKPGSQTGDKQSQGQSAKSGGSSNRNRRRRGSNRSKSSESKATDVKTNDVSNSQAKNTEAKSSSATSDKQSRPVSDKSGSSQSKPDKSSQANAPQSNKGQSNQGQSKAREASKPVSENKATKPSAAKPSTGSAEKKADKQPASNENRSATSVIND